MQVGFSLPLADLLIMNRRDAACDSECGSQAADDLLNRLCTAHRDEH
jgi:hypothetical protein